MNYSELLQLAKGWSNFIFYRTIIWRLLWTMVSCSAGALFLRIPLVYLFGKYFAEDLGKLGMIAPTVSGIMAAYTLFYVIYEGKKNGKKSVVSDR